MSDALGLLSLSRKAGKIKLGETPVLSEIDSRKARLVLVASDAAANTVRRIRKAVEKTHIVFVVAPYTKEQLGSAFGRASLAACAVSDIGFSAAFLGALEALSPGKYDSQIRAIRETADRIALRKQKKPGQGTGKADKT
ncbi:MAG: 50S ribosomal protein L7 [Clostridiales bacterium]|jgi:ribosomal protein L7Ae-like RNA K-turn-binding protein|nr:50S ribosomal protein L7 [Clostridiales bacterium]